MKTFFIFAFSISLFSPAFTFAVNVGLNCPIIWEWTSTGYTSCTSSNFPVNPPGTGGQAQTPGSTGSGSQNASLSCENINTGQTGNTSATVNFVDRGCWKPGPESTHGGQLCNCGTNPNGGGTQAFDCASSQCRLCGGTNQPACLSGGAGAGTGCAAAGDACGGSTGGTGTYSISAAPNPVQICSPNTTGTTGISWQAPANELVVVYVGAVPMVQGNGSGSESANWIQTGQTYTFNLFRITGGAQELKDSVTVSTTNAGCGSTARYGCSAGSCVRDDANGTFTSPTCNNSCGTTGPVCGNGIREGIEECDGSNVDCGGSTTQCSSSCTCSDTPPPPPIFYRCDATRGCVPGGPLSFAQCTATCVNPNNTTDLGFGQGYPKTYTSTVGEDVPVYWEAFGSQLGSCAVQRNDGAGWYANGWTGEGGATSINWAAGTYQFKNRCSLTIGGFIESSPATLTVNPVAGATFNCASNTCIPCGGARQDACNGSGSTCTTAGQSCGVVAQQYSCGTSCAPCGGGSGKPACSGNTYTSASQCTTACSAGTCGNGICEAGETNASCPADCNDLASCVGGQATIVVPPNGRVITNSDFSVRFQFSNVGRARWTSPLYAVRVTPSSDAAGWRFGGTNNPLNSTTGIFPLSPNTVAGQVNGTMIYGVTDPYTISVRAPGTIGNYALAFRVNNNGVQLNDSCRVNGPGGTVTVVAPQCSDKADNDGDGKVDCTPGAEDPGCFPDGNGGSGACNPNDDDETDSTGANMNIAANPQLVRQGGSANVVFTCDASAWTLSGPQVANLANASRDITTPGCTSPNVFCGTRAVTDEIFPATNIQVKETYTLSCGGRTKSATISVIKINEI